MKSQGSSNSALVSDLLGFATGKAVGVELDETEYNN